MESVGYAENIAVNPVAVERMCRREFYKCRPTCTVENPAVGQGVSAAALAGIGVADRMAFPENEVVGR